MTKEKKFQAMVFSIPVTMGWQNAWLKQLLNPISKHNDVFGEEEIPFIDWGLFLRSDINNPSERTNHKGFLHDFLNWD